MKFLSSIGSVLGWIFLIYYCWSDAIPWWFKSFVSRTSKEVPEMVKQLPKEDWLRPDNKNPAPQPNSSQSQDGTKNILSFEGQLFGIRSRYNLGIEQSEKQEQLGREDMGAK